MPRASKPPPPKPRDDRPCASERVPKQELGEHRRGEKQTQAGYSFYHRAHRQHAPEQDGCSHAAPDRGSEHDFIVFHVTDIAPASEPSQMT
jgi:hypothetical protein